MSSRFLLRRTDERQAPYRPDPAQHAVIGHRTGPLLVLGGPGTGKTSTLIEAVAARVAEGTPPEDVLVFTFGRRGAQRLRRRIAARIAPASGGTIGEVHVHTFHGYAFAVLRTAGGPPPKLLTGPEQDLIIREMLAEADGVAWPEQLKAAVPTRGFAAQLRDLLLRCAERGIQPWRLAAYADAHDRPDWTAAAAFYHAYIDQLALREDGSRYDTAEIIRVAAAKLRTDPTLARHHRPSFVYVDELHDTDPGQLALLAEIAGAGAHLVAFADPGSATFAFRGADPEGVRAFPELFPTVHGEPAPTAVLDTCHRSSAGVLAAQHSVARRLTGAGRHRTRKLPEDAPDAVNLDDVRVRVFHGSSAEAAYIADQLRVAHLKQGVPLSRMAIIVKSTHGHLPVLSRALRQAGVPVTVAAEDLPLSAQPIVRPLLTLIRCGMDAKHLDEDTAVFLLHSPYGGADPMSERRLRQGLRAAAAARGDRRPSGELLVDAVLDPETALGDRGQGEDPDAGEPPWLAPVRRIGEALTLVRATKGGVEEVLWALWRHSGLADRLTALALSGGPRSAAADADLDAMMTLFDGAARFADRLPGAGPEVFVEHVLAQELPADTLAAHAERGEAVRVLTAHAAKGLEWDLVVIAGVHEGTWPNLRPRDGILSADLLVDIDAGRPARDVNRAAVLLAEERRLFYAATGRARHRLLVTSVDDEDDGVPSRFLEELGVPVHDALPPARPLTLPSLVATLRTAAADTEAPEPRRRAAAAQLARLAAEGVPGADPDTWWGLAPLSDDRPLALPGDTVTVSPSSVEKALECGLRWVLERHGGSGASGTAQQIGNLVHAAAEEAGGLSNVDDVVEAMEAYVGANMDSLPVEAPWLSARQDERIRTMVAKFAGWLKDNKRELLATEQGFTARLTDGELTIELSGKVDRLERDDSGRLYIVDLKTGTVAPTGKEIEHNAQLGAYQLAAESGAFADVDGVAPDAESGGAALVQLGKDAKSASVQEQPALAETADPTWAEGVVRDVARKMASSTFEAVHTDKCRTCAVKDACPISGKGRTVTE